MTDDAPLEADGDLLVAALRGPSPRYKRAAVDAVVANRDATVPVMLELLETWAEDPGLAAREIGSDFDLIYIAVILAHLRESRAHGPLVRIARAPQEGGDLLDSFVGEGLDAMLVATCDGELTGLRALLSDVDADAFVRGAAASALAYGARHLGWLSVDDARRELVERFERATYEPDPGFFTTSIFGTLLLELGPGEYREWLVEAFDSGFVEPLFVDRETVVDAPAEPDDNARFELSRYLDADLHDWLSWWYCFRRPAALEEARAKQKKARDALKGRRKRERRNRKASRRRGKRSR